MPNMGYEGIIQYSHEKARKLNQEKKARRVCFLNIITIFATLFEEMQTHLAISEQTLHVSGAYSSVG